MSSINYWKCRHAFTTDAHRPTRYARSWDGDEGARLIECALFYRYLQRITRDDTDLLRQRVLEIGCGAFTWDEAPGLTDLLKNFGAYLGLDGAPDAIAQARTESLAPDHFHFEVADLTNTSKLVERIERFRPTMIVSRRVIQNLIPIEQFALIASLPKTPYLFLIEDTKDGRDRLNKLREQHGKTPLAVPHFNWPLSSEVVMETVAKYEAYVDYPMAKYFYVTRVRKADCRYTDASALLAYSGLDGYAILPSSERLDAHGIGPTLITAGARQNGVL